MKNEELAKILENHKHYLNKDCEDWMGMKAHFTFAWFKCADFSEENLNDLDFNFAYLNNSDFHGSTLINARIAFASLSDANFANANLTGASLHHACLINTNLTNAKLRHANLNGADLSGANLSGANLSGANLSGANLSCANLSGANLHFADLDGAYLAGANFINADLDGASIYNVTLDSYDSISRAKNAPHIPMACPDTGAFIGWKKARFDKIVKLLIPEDAKRSSGCGRKCRCDKAMVVSIEELDGTTATELVAYSTREPKFAYRLGETVYVTDFDDDRFNECSNGIHFFINRGEAVEY